uniref:Uncharacterized protein n=3 Tax=Caenorhabditis japonica TaxID=281687 RepID=A0A8R1E8E3_CAEJA
MTLVFTYHFESMTGLFVSSSGLVVISLIIPKGNPQRVKVMSILPFLVALFLIIETATSTLVPRSSRYGVFAIGHDKPDETTFVEHKRYDRNCFFSPVQCMLTYNDDTSLPLVVTRKASGVKRFDPFGYA